MKRVVITLAGAALLGLVVGTASAEHPHRYRGFVEYHGVHEYVGGHGHRNHTAYRSTRGSRHRFRSYQGLTHDQAVRLIMARHSRYRYHTHPRSMYNEPPRYRDYRR
jgi:hypothetical protein